MTFSEFAKLLYPYCSNGESKAEFVKVLTNQIMDGQPARGHADGGYQNPLLDKDTRTLEMYYDGDRAIPKTSASILFRSHDGSKFEDFVQHQCSNDALQELRETLKAKTGRDSGTLPERLCAELFIEILKDLAGA